ncbi:MAG: DEAD/DEAH box helicase [Proteobacteria bacterium]|nr:DEAD/DEAH box helicase [Pseudomonadota bacterium]
MKRQGRFTRRRQIVPRSINRKPRLTLQLQKILDGIGVPSSAPFRPDPFQIAAGDALRSGDVLVIAPTGSGKTWIAEEAIRACLKADKRSWYASPLKALSNSKYQEFSRLFGAPSVGILTGDRKENPDAPLIIGTTEILRNQLYDAMMEGRDIPVDLAILDEAHYLGDPDRGVVWEEVLIYLPKRVRMLLLSATIGNSDEIRGWLEDIRGVECHVVQHDRRPVPLHLLFMFPDGELSPLGDRRGVLPKITRFLAGSRIPNKAVSKVNFHFGWVIEQLRTWDLLPAIFFLKSRADCDRAVEKTLARSVPRQDDLNFKSDLEKYLEQHPFLRGQRQLPYLERFRVGSHHGGQLPRWKLLIEEMMNRGYLDAIFSTSTVAAGVNFPARTVVLVQSDRFDGRRFSDLTATELHQMAGRAGRRGKDRIGFALVLPGLYQDPLLIHQLIDSPPEPIRSQIQMSFSMVLNLLLSHRPDHIRDLLDKSLAAFQDQHLDPGFMRQWRASFVKLKRMVPKGAMPQDEPFEFLKALQMHAGLRDRIQALKTDIANERKELLFSQYLKRGRLFVDHKNRVYVAFHPFCRHGKLYCSAHRLTRIVKVKRNQIRLKKIALETIDHLLDYRLDLPEDASRETLGSIFSSIPFDRVQPMGLPLKGSSSYEKELRAAEMELAALPYIRRLHTVVESNRKAKVLLRKLERLALRTGQVQHYLSNEFSRHLEFLRETGFVDQDNRLTPDGRWASCLRLDHPLLIAEAIRRGLFDGVEAATLASLIAPFVVDKTRPVEVQDDGREELDGLKRRLTEMTYGLDPLQRLKRHRGFETLEIQFWPAASLLLWANGMAWNELIRTTSVEEGDMAMLITRTADHLRQLLDLDKTHPKLAGRAREALPLILREPVLFP